METSSSLSVAILVVACGWPTGPVLGAENDSKPSIVISQEKSKALIEAAFVQRAASAAFREIELGRLAMDRAESPLVKAFAGTLVEDHQAASERLRKLASRRHIAFPDTNTVVIPKVETEPPKDSAPMPEKEGSKPPIKAPATNPPMSAPGGTNHPVATAEQRNPREHLGSLTRRDFDSAYLKQVIQGHRDLIALYESVARASVDAGLESHLEAELPKWRGHLARAQQMLGEGNDADPGPGPDGP